MAQQRHGEPLQPEADAGRVRNTAIRQSDVPDAAEVIQMIIEADAGGRAFGAVHRDQQLEFQLQLTLAIGHHFAGAAKERVIGHIHIVGQR